MEVNFEKFRPGIVAVIREASGLVLLCERADFPGSWQFPQGGLEPGETPRDALFRELKEEIGENRCRILLEAATTTKYRWKAPGAHGVGQEHYWFLVEFEEGAKPNLPSSDGSFRSWKWAAPAELIPLLFPEKRAAFCEGLKNLGLLN